MRKLVCLLVTLLTAAQAAPTTSAASRPNGLFIITDQQFAEAMSCRMGERLLKTPNMDRLAREGMLFTKAYSSNPLCMPYRNSVFTGLYPHQTGVTRNEKPRGFDPKKFTCLGTYFRNAGYEAAYSGKWHLCFNPEETGFEMLDVKAKGDNHDGRVTERAVKFLESPHQKPFLLVASYLNPHNICEWARRLAGRQQVLTCGEIGTPPDSPQLPPAPLNLLAPVGESDAMLLMRQAYQVDSGPFPVNRFQEGDWRKHRWGYYRMVEKVDAEIGTLLAALRKAGLEQNTVIVFTSDHGECAGAHHWNQKTVFYEESARVPLIVCYKGRVSQGVCDRLVNTGIDLLPTMLDFAGLEIPKLLPGCSLMPLACGKPVEAWRDCIVVQNDLAQAGELEGIKPHMEGRMVRTQRYKYCVYSRGEHRESLFDLQGDPGETVNLASQAQSQSLLQEHRRLLERYAREHDDPLALELLANGVGPMPFEKPGK